MYALAQRPAAGGVLGRAPPRASLRRDEREPESGESARESNPAGGCATRAGGRSGTSPSCRPAAAGRLIPGTPDMELTARLLDSRLRCSPQAQIGVQHGSGVEGAGEGEVGRILLTRPGVFYRILVYLLAPRWAAKGLVEHCRCRIRSVRSPERADGSAARIRLSACRNWSRAATAIRRRCPTGCATTAAGTRVAR